MPSHAGSPGPNSPFACPSATSLGQHRGAAQMKCLDRRPLLVERDVDDLVHAGWLVIWSRMRWCSVISTARNRCEAEPGPGGRAGGFRQGAELIGADRLASACLEGKKR